MRGAQYNTIYMKKCSPVDSIFVHGFMVKQRSHRLNPDDSLFRKFLFFVDRIKQSGHGISRYMHVRHEFHIVLANLDP